VTIASVNAIMPDPLVVDYGAANAALAKFCMALSKEAGPRGRTGQHGQPGPVATPLWLEERCPNRRHGHRQYGLWAARCFASAFELTATADEARVEPARRRRSQMTALAPSTSWWTVHDDRRPCGLEAAGSRRRLASPTEAMAVADVTGRRGMSSAVEVRLPHRPAADLRSAEVA
jgi:NAD(P)-dependent dehydrogenase (short-subunit alcohol dehydrogenase family)